MMIKFIKGLIPHLLGLFCSLIVGFAGIIRYYPAGKPDGLGLYGDGSYIEFNLFYYSVTFLLFELVIYFYYSDEND